MKDFDVLNKALGEIKGGLTGLYESSVGEASEDKTCSTFCTETCSNSMGTEVGAVKGFITHPLKPVTK